MRTGSHVGPSHLGLHWLKKQDPRQLAYKDLRPRLTECLHNSANSLFTASDCCCNAALAVHIEVVVYCECRMSEDHKLKLHNLVECYFHTGILGIKVISIRTAVTFPFVSAVKRNGNMSQLKTLCIKHVFIIKEMSS